MLAVNAFTRMALSVVLVCGHKEVMDFLRVFYYLGRFHRSMLLSKIVEVVFT